MHADTLSLIQRFHSPPGAAGGAVLAARVTELQIRLQAAHQELAAERLAAQAAKELVLQNADRCAVELVRQVRALPGSPESAGTGSTVAATFEEEGARVVEGLRRYAREGAGEEGTSFEMDAGLSAPARISVTARFQRREVWTMRNRVSGERGRTDDARGSEWTFTRELPRRLPVRGELETPWRLDDIA